MNFLKRKNKYIEILAIEAYLKTALHPIMPRQAFVSGLRERLMVQAASAAAPELIIREEPRNVSRGWILAGGVLGSLVVLAVSIRGLISMFGVAGSLLKRFGTGEHARASQLAH